MSCFAMRGESELKSYNNRNTLTPEINVSKESEPHQKLPCISSFIHLKRKRLDLAAVSNPEFCHPGWNETTLSNEDCRHTRSDFDTKSQGVNFDYHLPSLAPMQGLNRKVENPNPVSHQGPYAHADLTTDEKIDYYFNQATERACEQYREDHGGVWMAPREDNNNSCLQDYGTTSRDLESLDVVSQVQADSARSFSCVVEQALESTTADGDGYCYSTNVSIPHLHSEAWYFLPVQTQGQYESMYQATSAAIQYEHMSPSSSLSSSSSSSSSSFMSYGISDGYGFSSNSNSEEDMRCAPEARNTTAYNDNNNNNNNINYDNLNFHWRAQEDGHVLLGFQNRAPIATLSTNQITGGGVSNAEGLRYVPTTELSPHFEATPEANPGGIRPEFVSGTAWSWMNNDNENNGKANNSGDDMSMSSGAAFGLDHRDIDAFSTSVGHDVSSNAVKDDAKIDDDILDEGLKSKGRKPDLSYMALISKAILSSPDKRMLLSDIYDYLSQNYTDIKSNQRAWRNSVRHNLSLNECFVKQERLGRGRGHYWSIHPACVEDFIKGDFRRRQARRRAKKCSFGGDEPTAMARSSALSLGEPSASGHVDMTTTSFSRATDLPVASNIHNMANINGFNSKISCHDIM